MSAMNENFFSLIMARLLVIGIAALLVTVVATVGMWLTFRKAGKAGWLSLIPFAREYTLTEISWTGSIGLMAYAVLPGLGNYFISRIPHYIELNEGADKPIYLILLILGLALLVLSFVLHVMSSVKLARAFNKGVGFMIGLILLLPIFLLILGVDKSSYTRSDFNAMGLKASARISNTIIYVVLVVISIIWLIPFVCIVLQSFRMESTGRVGYVLPQVWGIGNYKKLFDPNTNFLKWYLNTFIIALVVAVVQTIIVLCMSYTLSRFRFKMRAGLMRFMLILGMFPGMLAMIILYRVLDDLHLTGQYGNAVPGLILVYVASSGMGYYVSKGFFDTIPKSLDEAARVDGANRAQVLVKIILPLAKPIVIYTVLTAFMGPWGDFVFARYVSQVIPKAMNVAVGLQSWLATDTMVHDNYTLFCAGGVVVALPVAILFMCLQRYYVEGVTGGAVKG